MINNGRLACALVLLMAAAPAVAARATVHAWVTTGDQSRLLTPSAPAQFGRARLAATVIEVDPTQRYQQMAGFGAAITDASAQLITQNLDAPTSASLLRELFGREGEGIGLSFTRLTIGASDFSSEHYSFDDMAPGQRDPELRQFSINHHRADVLPVVKAALAINPQLKVMASPWSAPGWMKTTDSLIKGQLRADAYPAFAEYLNRYVEACRAAGVEISALTLQNEPHFEPSDYPGMRMEPAARAAFVGGYLGPLLAKRNPGTALFDWDHNWNEPDSPAAVLADARAAGYIAGVAWHCYGGDVRVQSALHAARPDKEVWFTECSGGEWASSFSDNLLYFTRTLVIGATRNWARGVLFWNLALDQDGGPHKGGCGNCRGVVTIDSGTGKVTRNVEYYALAHASRFVRPGAYRVASTSGYDDLDTVAFRDAGNGAMTLLVANSAMQARAFSVRVAGRSFRYQLPAASVATFIWGGR